MTLFCHFLQLLPQEGLPAGSLQLCSCPTVDCSGVRLLHPIIKGAQHQRELRLGAEQMHFAALLHTAQNRADTKSLTQKAMMLGSIRSAPVIRAKHRELTLLPCRCAKQLCKTERIPGNLVCTVLFACFFPWCTVSNALHKIHLVLPASFRPYQEKTKRKA